ncbi:MAG: hypothetical protein WC294_05815 [Methanoregula sp.]|jgi:hypothetical protein
MKFFFAAAAIGIFILILFCSGCADTSRQVPLQTTAPTYPITKTPVSPTFVTAPAAVAYPDALPVGQYATFGSGDRQGKATVYDYEIKPNYTWTSPTFNSPAEQSAASPPNELEHGYNLESPKQGDTFLFVYVRVINTGSAAVYAPSASQFIVYVNGTVYNYTPVHSSDVIIDKVFGTQYDYQIGTGGVVGYVQPGDSNKAEGYLIYEVPAGITSPDVYVIANLDYRNQAIWKLG